MIHRYTVEEIQRMHITELELALKASERRNEILQSIVDAKTNYADQLRQELNRLRSGHPEVKATNGCAGCRYLSADSNRQWVCGAFGSPINMLYPSPCSHGPYLLRQDINPLDHEQSK